MHDYEKKLMEFGKAYDRKKQEAASRKGALMNTLEALKSEHGVETAEEAQKLVTDLEAKVRKWEEERLKLMDEIEAGLAGKDPETEVKDDPDDDDFDFDDFEE